MAEILLAARETHPPTPAAAHVILEPLPNPLEPVFREGLGDCQGMMGWGEDGEHLRTFLSGAGLSGSENLGM